LDEYIGAAMESGRRHALPLLRAGLRRFEPLEPSESPKKRKAGKLPFHKHCCQNL